MGKGAIERKADEQESYRETHERVREQRRGTTGKPRGETESARGAEKEGGKGRVSVWERRAVHKAETGLENLGDVRVRGGGVWGGGRREAKPNRIG